jgi:hypothetical protein
MKFSLRSLMIGITLICVLLGGRIEYLRRMAEYHRREEVILTAKLHELSLAEPPDLEGYASRIPMEGHFDECVGLVDCILDHQLMTKRYMEAISNPWTVVQQVESSP